MTRERKITRRLTAFPWISTTVDRGMSIELGTARPIMSFVSTRPPQGYDAWCRRFKAKRRKAGG